jgi:hypothetical protein
VTTSVARQECYPAAIEGAQNVSIRGISKRSLQLHLVRVVETRHVVQTTAADNANLCLLQVRS